jgi:ribosomal protein S18 acetylase RimI-like enzyme
MTPAASLECSGRTAAGHASSRAVADVRPFAPADADAVARLVREVFDEHVAPDFEPEGIAEMYAYISAAAIAERAQTYSTLVAWEGPTVIGVIEVRNAEHVSMLFVRTLHMGRGIAAALMAHAQAICRAAGGAAMTVNSSLYAQGFYERMGYAACSEPQRYHGFVFVPMEKQLLEG